MPLPNAVKERCAASAFTVEIDCVMQPGLKVGPDVMDGVEAAGQLFYVLGVPRNPLLHLLFTKGVADLRLDDLGLALRPLPCVALIEFDQPLDQPALERRKDVLRAEGGLLLIDALVGILDAQFPLGIVDVLLDPRLGHRPYITYSVGDASRSECGRWK